MTKDEALKLALEALEYPGNIWHMNCPKNESITAIKEALAQSETPPECVTEAEKKAFAFGWWKAMEAQRLAQPEQEHVACPYCKNWATLGAVFYDQNCLGCVKRMTAPPQRTWVGLTDEDRKPLIQQAMMYYGHNKEYWLQTSGAGFCLLVQAIEAKLKEKNA